MQTFRSELERVRENYVRKYLDALHEYHAQGQKVATELQSQINNPEKSKNFYMGCSRLDLILLEPLQAIEVHTDRVSPSQSIHSLDNGLIVRLSECGWFGIDFECNQFNQADPSFDAWFQKWYDVTDVRAGAENGLSGVIHCATAVQLNDYDKFVFSVDFGSATIESLLELVDVFHKQGNTEVSMSTELSKRFLESI